MFRAWYGIVRTGGQAGFALDKLTEMLAEKYPGAYKSLREDRYVDDILSGEDSKQRREEQIEAVQERMSKFQQKKIQLKFLLIDALILYLTEFKLSYTSNPPKKIQEKKSFSGIKKHTNI